jgi:hypothetical protein
MREKVLGPLGLTNTTDPGPGTPAIPEPALHSCTSEPDHAAGRWPDAEAELLGALELLDGRPALRESALCRLADLRLRQGRIEDAAVLLEGLDHHEDATLPLARLLLAQGRAAVAVELINRVLAAEGLPDYAEAPLLALADRPAFEQRRSTASISPRSRTR